MINKLDNKESNWGALAPSGLASNVEFCKKCVISNQKPISSIESGHTKNDYKRTVNFRDGICDACRWAHAKEHEIDWSVREVELKELCDKHRKENGQYDVIVPASGGKDSRYVAHILKERYKMNPLTVTWKPHKFTSVGFQNFMGLIDSGQANLMFSPPGDVQSRLTTLAFENIGHPHQPFIIGQRAVGPKAALNYQVKLIFYGENVAEYGNRIEDNYSPLMDPGLYTCFDFDESNLDTYLLSGVPLRDLIDQYGFVLSDLEQYKSPSRLEIESSGVEVHYMSYYRKWIPKENYDYAMEHTGFKPNEKRKDGSYIKYAGIDDMVEDLHFFMQLIKFGMGRCTFDAAQEIRTGKLERDEAIALVSKYDQEPPIEYFQDILQYLNMSETKFWSIVDSFRSKHLWDKKSDGRFSLRHPVK